jgi:hypothetical protein
MRLSGPTSAQIGQEGQSAMELTNRIGKGSMDLLRS